MMRMGLMSRCAIAVALVLTGWHTYAAADLNAQYRLNVPPLPVFEALKQFSAQTNLQIVYYSEVAEGINSPGAVGELTAGDALGKLLGGTGLTFQFLNDRTVAIVQAGTPPRRVGDAAPASREVPDLVRLAQAVGVSNADSAQMEAASSESRRAEATSARNSQQRVNSEELGEIVVVGTHIRGAQIASPVVTITREEMRLAGHNNLGEAMRALPQNFSGGQNPGVLVGASIGNVGNVNVSGGSSVNLRGLGADATLTLLNGTRLPYDGSRQATDVSVIPVAAIDRVEILLDGASAIYGSDAVGGVVNIIPKRDYTGAEVAARYGLATDGGYEQQQYIAVAGHGWESGSMLLTGDYSRNSDVDASQRDYLSAMPNGQNQTIYPFAVQKSAFLTGHQDIGDSLELAWDAFYTARTQERTEDQTSAGSLRFEFGASSEIWGIAPSVRVALPLDWSLRVHGLGGRNDAESRTAGYTGSGAQSFNGHSRDSNKVATAGIETEGRLFALPGGDVRASIGGGWRKNTYELKSLLTGATSTAGEDSSNYAYGEVNLPLISEAQGVPLVARFTVNGAVRYEDYDSFGETTTPKVGVLWSPVPSLDFRASWGKSFKVPTLSQQFSSTFLRLRRPQVFGNPPGSAGRSIMFLSGGNPGLEPERAEVITAGFIVRPEFLPGLTLEFSWFDIDYEDRIVQPITLTSQSFNAIFAELVALNPTVAQQQAAFAVAGLPVGSFTSVDPGLTYDPATVFAVVDNRSTNASAQEAHGIDLAARYTLQLSGGSLTASGNASWIDGTRALTTSAPESPVTGVVFFPAEFKARAGVSWARAGFTLAASVNHVDGITNTLVTPSADGQSMTTCDVVLDYQTESSLVGAIGFNLAVTNLFDEAPPFLQPALPIFVSYDSTNYSGLGRILSATVTKRF